MHAVTLAAETLAAVSPLWFGTPYTREVARRVCRIRVSIQAAAHKSTSLNTTVEQGILAGLSFHSITPTTAGHGYPFDLGAAFILGMLSGILAGLGFHSITPAFKLAGIVFTAPPL
jgi:hypothetical protein